MSETLVYSAEFFATIEKKLDRHPRRCRGCGAIDGEPVHAKTGRKRKVPAVVRLALIDPGGPPNAAANVDLFCTRCRSNAEWRQARRIRPSKLP
jgi:hypothetical protein